jgi:hypothetical protein
MYCLIGVVNIFKGILELYDLVDLWKDSPMFQFFRNFHYNPPIKCRSCIEYLQCMVVVG